MRHLKNRLDPNFEPPSLSIDYEREEKLEMGDKVNELMGICSGVINDVHWTTEDDLCIYEDSNISQAMQLIADGAIPENAKKESTIPRLLEMTANPLSMKKMDAENISFPFSHALVRCVDQKLSFITPVSRFITEGYLKVDDIDPKTGKTLLMQAASVGNKSMVKLLLDLGADISKQSNEKMFVPKEVTPGTALAYATLNDHHETSALIKSWSIRLSVIEMTSHHVARNIPRRSPF
jgi:hypothetical protein